MQSVIHYILIASVAQAAIVSSFITSPRVALPTPCVDSHIGTLMARHQQHEEHEKQSYRSQQCQNNEKVVSPMPTTIPPSRRSFLRSSIVVPTSAAFLIASNFNTQPSHAADEEISNEPTVQTPLYFILRVREATEQETRLIKSGKFKDVQRANVKLAVKFMLDNYRLNDNFIAASAYLAGDRKIKAVNIGQTTVQNLITILEYFDSSDVENIKIGSTGIGGKEVLVLNGLAAARKGIDDFVSLFPREDVSAVVARIEEENELNRLEFDSDLGTILNPKPTQS